MQNSQHIRKVTPKSPRRARRGALMPAALLAVLLITILMTAFAEAQLRKASAARTEARAVQLAAIAADFDYYVHADPDGSMSLLMENTQGGKLTPSDQLLFEQYLRDDITREISGFTLTYLVGRIADSGGNDGDIYGGLLLSASATNGVSETDMDTLIAKLATYGAQANSAEADEQNNRPQGGVLDHAVFVQNVLEDGLTGSERVILTAPLSGLDRKYVLRERRAGHPAPKLVARGTLDLKGKNLNVKTLTATDKVMATKVDAANLITQGCSGC